MCFNLKIICYTYEVFSKTSFVKKVIGIVFLLSFFVPLLFVYGHVKNMSTMDMPIFGCPLMNQTAVVCTMSPIEHIEAWQHMFTATSETLPLMLLICLLLFFGSKAFHNFFNPPRIIVSLRKYFSPTQNQFTYNYLKESFSRGILNPKLF